MKVIILWGLPDADHVTLNQAGRLSFSVSENNPEGSLFGHLQEFLILDARCLQRPQLPCDDDTWEVASGRVPAKFLRLKDSPTRAYAGQPGTSQVHWGSLAPQFSERILASRIYGIQHLSILISWVIYEPQTSKTSLFLSVYLCQTCIVNKLYPPFTHSFSMWTERSPRQGAGPGLACKGKSKRVTCFLGSCIPV